MDTAIRVPMKFNVLVNLIIEEIGEYTKFDKLPDRMPYGFLVYPDGSIDEISTIGEHDSMAIDRGYKDLDHFFQKGGAHLAYNPDDRTIYILVDRRSTRSRKPLELAKDIARWYNKSFKVEPTHD